MAADEQDFVFVLHAAPGRLFEHGCLYNSREEVILTSLFPKSPYISSPLRGQVLLNCLRSAWENIH